MLSRIQSFQKTLERSLTTRSQFFSTFQIVLETAETDMPKKPGKKWTGGQVRKTPCPPVFTNRGNALAPKWTGGQGFGNFLSTPVRYTPYSIPLFFFPLFDSTTIFFLSTLSTFPLSS
jgi:hypothetical protein